MVLDETFVTAGTSHHSMEPRTAMAYWQNGKCHVFGSSQSQSAVLNGLARYIGIAPEDLVYVGEYCGGGFGSKGSAYPIMSVPAHMARKDGQAGDDAHQPGGRIRDRLGAGGIPGPDSHGLPKRRPAQRGRPLHLCRRTGPTAASATLTAPPERCRSFTRRWRCDSAGFRSSPTRQRGCAQRGPGQNQIACAVEPLLDKAAGELGIDQLAIRSVNAPDSNSLYGSGQGPVTSAHLGEALAQGAERFGWEERRARSGQRQGSRVTGVGIGQAYHGAGQSGQDGLVRIAPDGRLHIHTGVGNLGTYSYAGTSRVAAEILGYDWENVELVRGDSSRNLASSSAQVGSNTTFTMTRAGYAGAMDAVEKLKAIAAMDLGGSPGDYDVGDEATFARANPSRRISHARASARAIELGGRYSGEEFPRRPERHYQAFLAEPGGQRPDRRRPRQPPPERHGARARRRLHRDRAGCRDGHVRDRRLPGGGRLWHPWCIHRGWRPR